MRAHPSQVNRDCDYMGGTLWRNATDFEVCMRLHHFAVAVALLSALSRMKSDNTCGYERGVFYTTVHEMQATRFNSSASIYGPQRYLYTHLFRWHHHFSVFQHGFVREKWVHAAMGIIFVISSAYRKLARAQILRTCIDHQP